ncbi:MAG: alanine glycine permease, partial [Bacteroidota bacterium]|nr:alanine glycine permease [Bacteroidota bacterium]
MKHKLSLLVFLFTSLIGSAQESAPIGIDDQIDQAFAPVSTFFSNVVFFTIFDIPFVLILLVFSALFFTVYFGFPNFRYFWRAIQTVRGKYEDIENHGAKVLYGEDGIANGVDLNKVDIEEHIEALDDDLAVDGDIVDTIRDESSAGEVSHFQALATAVSG